MLSGGYISLPRSDGSATTTVFRDESSAFYKLTQAVFLGDDAGLNKTPVNTGKQSEISTADDGPSWLTQLSSPKEPLPPDVADDVTKETLTNFPNTGVTPLPTALRPATPSEGLSWTEHPEIAEPPASPALRHHSIIVPLPARATKRSATANGAISTVIVADPACTERSSSSSSVPLERPHDTDQLAASPDGPTKPPGDSNDVSAHQSSRHHKAGKTLSIRKQSKNSTKNILPIDQTELPPAIMETLQIFPDVADELWVTKLHARANAHLHRFVDQCLEVCCLPRAWRSVLFKMLNKIYLHLRPSQMQKKSDKMDIRAYVKIKCVPGAGLGDCFFEHGLYFPRT